MKGFDPYTIVGIIIAITLAIFSPSVPKINSSGSIIIWLVTFIILVLVVILINLYLNSNTERNIIKRKIDEIEKHNKKLIEEIAFLKERFKTLTDLTEVRTEIKFIKNKLKI
ncbi:MAG: hypothetical protein Q8L29_02830 [archaeon]|nr:hypothetical protein [archaeon]